MSTKIFLAKSGKISGPFRAEQIEEMRVEGGLTAYSWIWDESRPAWEALDPAPAELPGKPLVPAKPERQPKPAPLVQSIPLDRALSAVCHDFKHATFGIIAALTGNGCEFVVDAQAEPIRFALGSKVHLNLFDEKTKKAVNLEATMSGLRHSAHGWCYELKWEVIPDFLSKKAML